ncbi:MAG: isoprenyl transferase [Lachnospiraceae bacterium]|nr:isoprenyl transferase [Lachnospiraceae bacterium]
MDMEKVPQHIAIIMDGNGRWAKKRGMPRNVGHSQGSKNVRKICEAAWKLGVKYLTVYALSTENWTRPQEEIDALMKILRGFLKDAVKQCTDNNMRVRIIGDISVLPEDIITSIHHLEEVSSVNTGLQFQIALNYGGKNEIVRAVKKAAVKLANEGKHIEYMTEEDISRSLDTAQIPDPDLIIRTSGEQRLSNFLMWQSAYSEFYFTDVLWPDFDKKALEEAITYYAGRNRRFGGLEDK